MTARTEHRPAVEPGSRVYIVRYGDRIEVFATYRDAALYSDAGWRAIRVRAFPLEYVVRGSE